MAPNVASELERFHQYIGDKLSNGAASLSPEEVLDEWRIQYPTPEEFAESVAAIRQALADMEAGDKGIPFEDFDREFRAKHKLPPRT